jgi:hypothetical protein
MCSVEGRSSLLALVLAALRRALLAGVIGLGQGLDGPRKALPDSRLGVLLVVTHDD